MSQSQAQSQPKLSLESQYLRDCNRLLDSDRTTRKRGLQRLLDSLPWDRARARASERVELLLFVHTHVLRNLLVCVGDSVEKCRELALKILKRLAEVWEKERDTDRREGESIFSLDDLAVVAQRLCERVNDVPFPEAAEELRLLTLEVLLDVVKKEVKVFKKKKQLKPDVSVANGSTPAEEEEVEKDEEQEDREIAIVGQEDVSGVVESMDVDVVSAGSTITANALDNLRSSFVNRIIHTLSKTLSDNFPQVKRISAELISLLCKHYPSIMKLEVKLVAKGLILNATHQHAKTRQLSLLALGKCLIILPTSGYRTLLQESVLQLFQRTLSDRTPVVKIELAKLLGAVLEHRMIISVKSRSALIDMDFELVVILILLASDEIEDVAAAGVTNLNKGVLPWKRNSIPLLSEMAMQEEVHVDNAELEMRKVVDVEEIHVGEAMDVSIDQLDEQALLKNFLTVYLQDTFDIILTGVDGWTTESKIRYLRGLQKLVRCVGEGMEVVSLTTVQVLAHQIREDDHEVRAAVEQTSSSLGEVLPITHLLELILPRVLGVISGTDTAQQRTGMLRLITHVWKGVQTKVDAVLALASEEDVVVFNRYQSAIELISQTVVHHSVLAYRDVTVREALVLLGRALADVCPVFLTKSQLLQQNLSMLYIHLLGKVGQETDSVAEVSRRDLLKLAERCLVLPTSLQQQLLPNELVIRFLSPYFLHLLGYVIYSSTSPTSEAVTNFDEALLQQRLVVDAYLPPWDDNKDRDRHLSNRVAFEVLVRECPYAAWTNWKFVLPIIKAFASPKASLVEGSTEYNMKQYAAVRGEEDLPTYAEVDIRLSFMALLEGMIRDAAKNWECSFYISQSSEYLIKNIIIPNLIWRVGRVEATIRKVALAAAYGILKAGAVQTETLFKIATEIVPLLVSHLDDMESTPRLMACLGLAVIFERLRGYFSDQAIREMYPKIIARLDDSSDDVRAACCSTLEKFLLSGTSKSCYTGTVIDYILDQLFIHLDDVNPEIQTAVFSTICVASAIDKNLVLKKAESNRLCHRSPALCDKVVVEVQGFEILTD